MKKEYDFKKMKEVETPIKKGVKRNVGLKISPEVIDYFKSMSETTGIPYQKLIDLYLLDCVKSQRTLKLDWTG